MKKIFILLYFSLFVVIQTIAQTSQVDSANIIEGVYLPTTAERMRIVEINKGFTAKARELSNANGQKAARGKRIQGVKALRDQRDNEIKQVLGDKNYALFIQNRFTKKTVRFIN